MKENNVYLLERAVLLLESINFDVVQTTMEERKELRELLLPAKKALQTGYDLLATFGLLHLWCGRVGAVGGQSNRWLHGVAHKIHEHFRSMGCGLCGSCGQVLPGKED